jgi:phosphatidylglycerophosphate synthase
MLKNINLSEVREKSRRDNAIINNRVHWFSSKFSIYFSYFFINLGLSADSVTKIFFLIGLAGALAAFKGGLIGSIIAYICWRLHIIIDMSDGDVARFNKSFSHRGKYWDAMIHSILNPLYSLLIPLGCFYQSHDVQFVFLGIGLMFSQSLLLATKYNFPSDAKITEAPTQIGEFEPWSIKRKVINQASELAGMEGFLSISLLLICLGVRDLLNLVFAGYITINLLISGIKFYQLSYYNKTFSKLS